MPNRRCILYKSSSSFRRHICLDMECAAEILDLLEETSVGKKFDYIVNRILEQKFIYYDDYVRLADYDHISEMRLFPGGLNIRIYCKEVSSIDGKFYVIAAKLLTKKKTQKINKSIKQLITPIEKYDYEIQGIANPDQGTSRGQN